MIGLYTGSINFPYAAVQIQLGSVGGIFFAKYEKIPFWMSIVSDLNELKDIDDEQRPKVSRLTIQPLRHNLSS